MLQKNFAEYSSEEFATEPLFIKWVKYPNDEEIGNFWQIWISKHPNKFDEIYEARTLIKTVSSEYKDLDLHESSSLWQRIQSSVAYLPKINDLESDFQSYTSSFSPIARIIVLFLGFLLLLWVVSKF